MKSLSECVISCQEGAALGLSWRRGGILMSEKAQFERVDEHIQYYQQNADRNLRTFRSFKITQILIGVSIPISSLVIPVLTTNYMLATIVNGVLGSLVAGIEGFLQLGQTERNWQRWRSTAEALKREKWRFRQNAGPYADPASGPKSSKVVFVERVEQIVSDEHAEWTASLHPMTEVKSSEQSGSQKQT
jgi:hypothetical protein